MNGRVDLERTHRPRGMSDRFARVVTTLLRFFADALFAKRYGHRDVNHALADQLDVTRA